MLTRGSQGDDVKQLQLQLQALNIYHGPIDGDYGPVTQAAVLEFQHRNLASGTADDKTVVAINGALAQNITQVKIPNGLQEVEAVYGHIEYMELDKPYGEVHITNDWQKLNIVKTTLPVVGPQYIHKLIEPSLNMILTKIASAGLGSKITQFGCYCPRHQLNNPKNPLSIHSWAAAVDINWNDNPLGKPGNMDPSIVQAFESFGWIWGGRWRNLDAMHFQRATNC